MRITETLLDFSGITKKDGELMNVSEADRLMSVESDTVLIEYNGSCQSSLSSRDCMSSKSIL